MSETDKQPQEETGARYERLILDTSSIGVVITRVADGTILYANPALGRILGIPNVADVIGAPVPNFYWDPSERAVVLEKFRAEGKVDDYELRVRQMNGTMIWTSISVQPFFFEGEQALLSEITDITKRKQVENALLREQALSQAVVNALPEPFFMLDANGRLILWNQAEERVLEYSAEELNGMTGLMTVAEEEREAIAAVMQKAFAEGRATARVTLQTKTGKRIPYLLTGSRLVTDEGTFLVGIGTDLTEEIEADRALRESEQRFRTVADFAYNWEFWRDPEGRYVYNSPSCKRISGYDSEEFEKNPNLLDEIIHPEDKEKWESHIREYHLTQISQDGETEFRIIAKNGETRWLNHVCHTVVDKAGNWLGRRASQEDITERKRAEEEIRRRLEIESLLTGISSKLAAAEAGTIDSVISESLETLGKFSRADRGYLFLIAEDRQTMSNTHEWCAEGIEAHISRLKNVSINAFPWLMERLSRLEVVNIPSVEDLPPEARAEKEEFQAEAIQSVIVIPIVYHNALAGFVGFDAVAEKREWEVDTLAAIRTVGETFMTAMERIRLQREIEQTLEKRGRQVQITNEISQEIASAPELSSLIERVVALTKERFGYYHVQLLRYDPTQDAVVLLKGYGETGQKMLEAGHKMPMGIGLIGTAAATSETVMRPTLANDPDWRPNPLLPKTQGEIAVPIKWKGQVLGVLDVQSDQAGALSEDDRLLLESLCGQIAMAMEETRLRQEMAERLEEVNRLYRAMSREGWQAYRQEQALPSGFMFDSLGIIPAVETPKENVVALPVALPGGEELGELVIPENPQRPLTQEDRVLLEQIAEQIALALESARLTAQTQSALAQTEKLSQASLQLTRAADLQELVKVAVETLAIEKINRALIGTFDYGAKGEMTGLSVVANWWNGTGHKVTDVGARYSADVIRIINLFQTSEPLFYNDTLNEPSVDEGTLQLVQRQNIRAVAVLPLFTGERQIGVLILESEEPHNFSPSEIRLFSAMGPQIATVLENRRQFERARKQAEREAMLNLISQKIQSASSVDDVLQIAARELGQALGAPITIAKLALKEK